MDGLADRHAGERTILEDLSGVNDEAKKPVIMSDASELVAIHMSPSRGSLQFPILLRKHQCVGLLG